MEKTESKSEVTQSCLTLCDPMDCSLPGSSVHGILQARVLERVAISFSRGSSWPRDQTWVSHIVDRHPNLWATREALMRLQWRIRWRRDRLHTPVLLGFPGKESACNAGDLGSIPGLGRSLGEGKDYPLQYSGLENPMDYIGGHKESDMTEQLSLEWRRYTQFINCFLIYSIQACSHRWCRSIISNLKN